MKTQQEFSILVLAEETGVLLTIVKKVYKVINSVLSLLSGGIRVLNVTLNVFLCLFQTCWIVTVVIKIIQSYEKYIGVKARETCSIITTPQHHQQSQRAGSATCNLCSKRAATAFYKFIFSHLSSFQGVTHNQADGTASKLLPPMGHRVYYNVYILGLPSFATRGHTSLKKTTKKRMFHCKQDTASFHFTHSWCGAEELH